MANFNDGGWEIKTLNETCEFILANIKIIHFDIKIPSNLSKKNILVDLFSVKSKIINNRDRHKIIEISIDEYEKGKALIECSGDIRFFIYHWEQNEYLYYL